MSDLQEWLDFSPQLENVYQQELGRSCFSDAQAFVNWAYHWREDNRSIQWIRDRIRESDEWAAKHGGVAPHPDPGPVPAPTHVTPTHDVQFIQVTDASDGRIPPRLYSYWSNAILRDDGSVIVFCGHEDGHPRFFSITRQGSVQRLGALVGYTGESEGWYWNADGWLYIISGSALHRVHPLSGEDEVVFDIGDDHPGCDLWQAHSSDNGQVHCATVRRLVSDGAYPHIATVLVQGNQRMYVPAIGVQDESHITSDGAWLIVEEDDANRVIDVRSGAERRIVDPDGALSHIDCGPGFMVGEDNINGKCWKWELNRWEKTALFDTWGMGHVSVRAGRCLLSGSQMLSWVDLNGGGLTPIREHKMRSDGSYDTQVKANLDPTGTVATYMTNSGGDRQDVVCLRFS